MNESEIRELAYLKWEKAGCPIGEENRFWAEAEQELNLQDISTESFGPVQVQLPEVIPIEKPKKKRGKK